MGKETRADSLIALLIGCTPDSLGKLGRKSGRVIVLLKGDVDIPSDLSGILFIRIDKGIEEAGEKIRKAINVAIGR